MGRGRARAVVRTDSEKRKDSEREQKDETEKSKEEDTVEIEPAKKPGPFPGSPTRTPQIKEPDGFSSDFSQAFKGMQSSDDPVEFNLDVDEQTDKPAFFKDEVLNPHFSSVFVPANSTVADSIYESSDSDSGIESDEDDFEPEPFPGRSSAILRTMPPKRSKSQISVRNSRSSSIGSIGQRTASMLSMLKKDVLPTERRDRVVSETAVEGPEIARPDVLPTTVDEADKLSSVSVPIPIPTTPTTHAGETPASAGDGRVGHARKWLMAGPWELGRAVSMKVSKLRSPRGSVPKDSGFATSDEIEKKKKEGEEKTSPTKPDPSTSPEKERRYTETDYLSRTIPLDFGPSAMLPPGIERQCGWPSPVWESADQAPIVEEGDAPELRGYVRVDPAPFTISAATTLDRIYFLFTMLQLSHCYVMAPGGVLVGVLGKRDVVRHHRLMADGPDGPPNIGPNMTKIAEIEQEEPQFSGTIAASGRVTPDRPKRRISLTKMTSKLKRKWEGSPSYSV